MEVIQVYARNVYERKVAEIFKVRDITTMLEIFEDTERYNTALYKPKVDALYEQIASLSDRNTRLGLSQRLKALGNGKPTTKLREVN
ncbi:hypothetical protein GOV13_00330 [Candidatus Pacearchaeota archaeon]|nr:hypothetical protein [Candidatus Pacearchaeota archaeon]